MRHPEGAERDASEAEDDGTKPFLDLAQFEKPPRHSLRVGQAMRATRGQANVALIADLFKQKLG